MPPGHHVLESIEITGGYLRGSRLDFADGLNCIIGGRGAGKTTILELLRFALGAPLSASPDPAATHDALIKATLPTGRVTVRVRTQHGARYESSRAYGEPPRVAGEGGALADVSLDGELFQIEACGQNQIERIATSRAAQIALLDRFVEPEARRLADAIADRERLLAQNASDLVRLEREIHEDEDRTGELPSVEEALRGLSHVDGPDAAEAQRAFEEKALRARERAAIPYVEGELRGLASALDDLAQSAKRRLEGAVDPDLGRGPNGPLFSGLAADLHDLAAAAGEALAALRARIEHAGKTLGDRRRELAVRHAEADAAYEALVARQDEDRGRAAERHRLEARQVELRSALRRLDERRREHADRRADRKRLLADLLRLRAERFALRRKVAEDISAALAGEVRVSVTQAGDTEAYEALLADVLRGANIRPASLLGEIARSIRPDDLAALVARDDPAPIAAIDDAKTGKLERARRILDALRASGRVLEVETVALDDVPLVELKVGDAYKPSAEVSTGQRCTSILPILLLYAASPLLIDQPEDNLDNAFIYDVLVKSIAIAKRTRQLVFVTHNPNIPVLGDAERVFVLAASGARGVVAEAGTVDEVRGSIERILEGGSEAFLRRSRRYGHAR